MQRRDGRGDPNDWSDGLSERPRLYFLDNLRAFAIVMVIVLHASITYIAHETLGLRQRSPPP